MRKALLPVAALFPILAQQPPDPFSYEKERALGRALAADLRRQSPPVEDALLTQYVTALANRLNEDSGSRYPLSLEITRETRRRDADALPGGYLRLPIGAIAAAASERDLAFVLAHGIAHIAARHGVRNAVQAPRQGSATIPWIFIGHEHSGQIIPRGLVPYYRQAEQEADTQAAALLNGFEPGTEFTSARDHAREITSALDPRPRRTGPPTLRRPGERQ